MTTINIAKELVEADSPVLLFECVLPNGDLQRFSSHAVDFNGNRFSARLLKHNLFDFQLSSEDAMDSIAQLSLTLANADSMMSEIGASIGWKGTQVVVYLVFADLATGQVTTEGIVLFRGVAGDPDEITEDSLKLTFANKLSLLRVGLPEIRIQRLCPWSFPATPAQRAEASGTDQFSRYYRCGYSADQAQGRGDLNSGSPFTSCDRTRESCQSRGMFSRDSKGVTTSRFGGFEFVPSTSLVRTYGEKVGHLSPVLDNSAKYNDFVPMVYGTGWLHAPVIFARNDGNLTHMEVLLGQGVIDSVLKVVVSDVEIPVAVTGTDMTATGWYNLVTRGEAQGAFNADFTDASRQPVGDPYGSVSVLSIVVPNSINNGRTLPIVEVLVRGMHLQRYNADGSFRDSIFTNNPAWITLDILRRAGWSLNDIAIATFAQTAEFCDALITTSDVHGNPIKVPRFHCNLILTKRKSAAEILRGIRVSSGLMLRYGTDGFLELLPETTVAQQHPHAPNGTNATQALNDGWPAYEFSDGSGAGSGIARDQNGRSTVRLISRALAELSNRISVEFQDEANEYQQDSLSVTDESDSVLIGREISSVSTALGIPNFNQALRILSRQLYKFTEGNKFVEFQTSFRALTLRPGDIIAFTYLKEGFERVPFRVVKLSPSMNFRRVAVFAQIHSDDWYADDPTSRSGNGRQPGAGVGIPLPLIGPTFDAYGETQFTIQEQTTGRTDGGDTTALSVAFVQRRLPTRTHQRFLCWTSLQILPYPEEH
jgi:Putative phage tail protein